MKGIFLGGLLAMSLTAVSCSRDRVIPRDRLAQIYAEMFITDEWINSDYAARRMADTTLVYEPVFEKYGYTSDDYRRSVAYYIEDPDRYARILRKTTVILEERIRDLKKEKEHQRSLSEKNAVTESFIPERIYYLSGMANRDLLTVDSVSFYIDSTGGSFMFDVQKGYDTLFTGPALRIVSDAVAVKDSVCVKCTEPADEPAANKTESTSVVRKISVTGQDRLDSGNFQVLDKMSDIQ